MDWILNKTGVQVIILEVLIEAGDSGLKQKELLKKLGESLPYFQENELFNYISMLHYGILTVIFEEISIENLTVTIDPDDGVYYVPKDQMGIIYSVNIPEANDFIKLSLEEYPNCKTDAIKYYRDMVEKRKHNYELEQYLLSQEPDRRDSLRNLLSQYWVKPGGITEYIFSKEKLEKLDTTELLEFEDRVKKVYEEIFKTHITKKKTVSQNLKGNGKSNQRKDNNSFKRHNSNQLINQFNSFLDKHEEGFVLPETYKTRFNLATLKICLTSLFVNNTLSIKDFLDLINETNIPELTSRLYSSVNSTSRVYFIKKVISEMQNKVVYKAFPEYLKELKMPTDKSSYITKSQSKRIIYSPNRG